MPVYEIHDKTVVYTDKDGGAVLLDDEMWYPFCYFCGGAKDIWTEGFHKPSTAYSMAKKIFT